MSTADYIRSELAHQVAVAEDRVLAEHLAEAAASATHYEHPTPEVAVPEPPAESADWIELFVQRPDGPDGKPVSIKTGEEYWRGKSCNSSDDDWAVWLPHSCDEWVIGSGNKAQVLRAIAELRRQLAAAAKVIRDA